MASKDVYLLLSLILVLYSSPNGASKILGIFPMPSKSHDILATALFKELANRGHEVTVLSPYTMENSIENYTEIHWNYIPLLGSDYMKGYSNPKGNILEKIRMTIEAFPIFFEILHRNENITKFVNRNEKFDLCINLVGYTESFLGICHHVNATTIGFNTIGMNIFLAPMLYNPTPYSYVPHVFLPFSDNMNFFERVINTLTWWTTDSLLKLIHIPLQGYLLKKFYPKAPPLEQLVDNVDLVLANTNYATDSLIPLVPNIIPIGGYHLEEKVHLPEDLQTILDTSKHGVIYFNLGTNAKGKYTSPEILNQINRAFSKLPYDVLWKYEDEMPDKPKNVHISNWFPQRPILAHSNVKVFMTHAGGGGTVEAIYGGVPMICMPHYGDQLKNCAGSVANGYAIHIDFTDITEENLIESINEIITNPRYKEAIMLKSDVYKNQAVSPMDRAVFWIEHAIKHKGAKHLKTRAGMLPWYQRYLLDVFLLLAVLAVTSFYIIYLFLRVCIRCGNGKPMEKYKQM